MAKNKLLQNTYIYALGEILPRLMSLFLLPVFTRYLSSEDYGVISYTSSIMLFLFVLSAFGLNTYLLRFYSESKNEVDKRKLIGNIFSIIIIFNTIILVVSYLIGPLIFRNVNLQFSFHPYLSISILNNFLEVFSIIPLLIFRLKGNANYFVILNVSRSVLTFAITYLLIAQFDWGLLGNYYGRLMVNLVFLIFYLLIIFRHAKLNLDFGQLKKAIKFSFPLIPGAISFLLISISDRIILERYVSLSLIGIYSVAYTLAFGLRVITISVYRAFEPEIYKQFKSENFSRFFRKGYKAYMFVILIAASFLAIFSKDILLLMTTGDFIQGYLLIPILLIGGIITSENVMLGTLVIAEKKTYLTSVSTIIGGGISVVFNLIFIPIYGIYAAALASAIAYTIMNFIFLRKLSFRVNVIKYDLIALVVFVFSSYMVVEYSDYIFFTFNILFVKTLFLGVLIFVYSFIYGINFTSIKELLPSKYDRKL